MNKNHIGQSFDSFLKSEGIEIKEKDLINIIAKWKNQKEFDINAGMNYYEFLKTVKDNKELYKYFESEKEIKKNSLKYGFTCLDEKGEIIPNYKIFQIDNKLIINESEEEK